MKLFHTFITACILYPIQIFSQGSWMGSPTDTPADVRSSTMGESFVAVKSPESAHIFNPAALEGFKSITLSYARRSTKLFSSSSYETNFSSISSALRTPYFLVSCFYNRNDLGKMVFTNVQYPQGYGESDIYYHTFGLAVSKSVSEKTNLGIGFKTLSLYYNPPYFRDSKGAVLFDVGFLHSFNIISAQQNIYDEFNIGLALQNFGSHASEEVRVGSYHFLNRFLYPMILRTGFSYSLVYHQNDSLLLAPLQLLISGEYRNMLNPSENSILSRDFWGLGFESTFYEFLVARLGGYASPEDGNYEERGKLVLRYGFGIHLPIERLGIQLPISISVDYGFIPTRQLEMDKRFNQVPNTLTLYSVRVDYQNNIFE